jgi:hypothetical protein
MKTSFRSLLLKSVKAFFKNNFEKSDQIIKQIISDDLAKDELWELHQFHMIFFLGQLLGLHTLNSILEIHQVPSNSVQIQYTKLCKALTNMKLSIIYEKIFKYNFEESIKKLATKSDSEWSKSNITVILDASIFKQFLIKNQEISEDNAYSNWYSGQYQRVVSGFKVVALGVHIKNIFYPLCFEFVKKKDKKESEIAISCRLIAKFDKIWQEMQKKYIDLPPKLHLSCDNGYNHKDILRACEQSNLIFIGVPKTNNLFVIDGESKPLSAWIEERFRFHKKDHSEKEDSKKDHSEKDRSKKDRSKKGDSVTDDFVKGNPSNDNSKKDNSKKDNSKKDNSKKDNSEKDNSKKDNSEKDAKNERIVRLKAYYSAFKMEVILLLFQFNGSKKVTTLFCPSEQSPFIFAKTMRHHWFARTQIEQFFKLIKHTLQISESKTQNKFEMSCKLFRFFWMALEAQQFRNFIRKRCSALQNHGFKQMVRFITFHVQKIDELEELIQAKKVSMERFFQTKAH